MATITKAQLEAQVQDLQSSLTTFEALQSELQQALARIEELEQQGSTPRNNDLTQVVWLQKNAPQGDARGFTQAGKKFIKFGAQYSSLDEQSGQRFYGAWKNFIAYGQAAERIAEFFQGGDRLVRIEAFERPWHGKPPAGSQYPTRNTEWIVTAFQPMPRVDAPATTPQTAASTAGYGEPTDAEIPF